MNPVLDWLTRAENPAGGISAWQMPNGQWHSQYIEISGYAIPTLLKWDAGPLAVRVADWLLHSQNPDGSYNGLDGVPRPFDTAAVIEGLDALYQACGAVQYRDAANRAKLWMHAQITPDGHLPDSPRNAEPRIYNLRASAIIGNRRELEYWKSRKLIHTRERTHYLAYALEGLLNFGALDFARPYLEMAYGSGNLLQPFHVDYDWRPLYADFDICASCQMAILFKRVGFDVEPHYQAIQKHIHPDGGVPQSTSDARAIAWGAKFYLDLAHAMGDKA